MLFREFRKQISSRHLQELPSFYIFTGPGKLISEFKEKGIQTLISVLANDKKPSAKKQISNIYIKRFELADFKEADFWNDVYAVPFLNIPKLIILNIGDKTNFIKEISDALKEFISVKSLFTKLVILIDDLKDCSVPLRNALNKKSYVVDFPPISEDELPAWIISELKHHGKKISPQDARLLVQKLGNNITEIDAVLEKIILFHKNSSEISSESISHFVYFERDFDINELTDAIVSRQADKALLISDQLLKKGEPVPKILGYLRWFFNYKFRHQRDKKLLSFRLRKILESDLAIKTGLMTEEMSLQILIVTLIAS